MTHDKIQKLWYLMAHISYKTKNYDGDLISQTKILRSKNKNFKKVKKSKT